MKNQKKIIIAVFTLVILVCGGIFTINAINADIEDAESIMSSEAALELDVKTPKFEEKYKKNNENDLTALKILRNYNKTDATDLIQDKQEDCNLMYEICDMIKNNIFTADEEQILKNYLERRLYLLDDYEEETGKENDSELIAEIKGILKYESYNR